MQPLLIGNMQKEEFYKLSENPGLLNEDSLTELQQITEEFPFFQAAWMLYLKNLQATGHSDYKAALKKAAIIIPGRKQLYRFLHSNSGGSASDYYFEQTGMRNPVSNDEDREEEQGGSLIDKFLSSEPTPIKVEKQEQEESPPEDSGNEIIVKSVSESDEMVTETLAMIYFEQKKYDKALDAFKKLSLKYPEKSVYFATRIEEINKLKNI
jgi:tetratricopeptide (TPR) repeat protein